MDGSLDKHLQKSKKRAFHHWYQDGLAEIGLGIFFLSLALLFFAGAYWPGLPISSLGLPVVIIGGVLLMAPILRRVKNRITYPKAGYVSYQQPSANRRIAAWLVGLGIGLVVAFIVASQWAAREVPDGEDSFLVWLPLIQGIALALILGYMAYRTAVWRFAAVALISLLAGLLLTGASLSLEVATCFYFLVTGLAFLISGAVVLRKFLSETKMRDGDSLS